MRKSLSLLLAVALVFAMFAPLALAEETTLTTEQKFEALKETGVFSGVLKSDGSTDAALDDNMTRAQFAIVIQKLLNLNEANPATPTFKDLPSTHWAYSAVQASVEAGILQGRGNGVYDPNADVSIQELAIVLVTAVGLSVDNSVTSVPGAAYWAAKYVQAAVAAGLIPAQASYTKAATRGQLVDASYVAAAAIAQSSVTTTEVKVISSKEISVTFSDGVTKSFAVDPALVSGVATQVSFEYNGKTYTETVTLKELSVTAKVVGAKKVDLNFNQAIDTSKATIAVKTGTSTVNVNTTTFSDDKTTATLAFTNALGKADYTVTVSGLTEKALTANFSIEDEKVAKIEFTNDRAVFDRTDAMVVTANIKVSNQYGEDVTSDYEGSLTITAGKGVASIADGVITLNNRGSANGAYNTDFALEEKVIVSVIHADSSTFASATLTVSGKAQVSAIKVDKLYHEDKDKKLDIDSTFGDFAIIVEAKDQYGNVMKNNTYLNEDLIVTVSNTTVVDVERSGNNHNFTNTDIDGTNYTSIKLVEPTNNNPGKSQISFISKITGARASIDIEVLDAVKVDKLTLSQPEFAVAGEEFEIPFTATDQFGNAVTHVDNLTIGTGKSILSLSASGAVKQGSANAEIYFKQDYVKGTAKLYVDARGNTDEGTIVISGVTASGKIASLTVRLKKPAIATVVAGTSDDIAKNFVPTAATTFKATDVVINDQYGREIGDAKLSAQLGTADGKYRINIKSGSKGKVSVSGTGVINGEEINLTDTATKVTFTAVEKGSSTITIKLQKLDGSTWKDVSNSTYTYTSKVVDKGDISSYEVADVDKLFDKATHNADAKNTAVTGDYTKELVVNGLLSDGKKVKVVPSYYEVQPANSAITVSGSVYADKTTISVANFSFGDDSTKEVAVVVIVKADGGPQQIIKNVTVSKATPEVATLEVIEKGIVTKEDTNVISVEQSKLTTKEALAAIAVKAVDQYGVEISPTYTVVDSTYSESTRNDITKVKAGDTFTLTAITGNKVVTFKVIVK